MILETERLIIREYTPDDFDVLYEILSDEETMKYYPKPYDENGVNRWIKWCIDTFKNAWNPSKIQAFYYFFKVTEKGAVFPLNSRFSGKSQKCE